MGRRVRGSRVYGESQERERIEQLKGKGKGRLELKVLNKMKRGVSSTACDITYAIQPTGYQIKYVSYKKN